MAKGKVFAVFGLGAFGSEFCRALSGRGVHVIAIDANERPVERIKDEVAQALLLDSTDEEALRAAPLDNVDVAVVAMDDVEPSVLTTALLKNLGVPYIVARAVTDIHMRVLRQVGANDVINPEIEEARRTAARLLAAEVGDKIPITPEHSIVEFPALRRWVGQSLEALDLRSRHRVIVVAIERQSMGVDDQGSPTREEQLIVPGGSDVLGADDVLLLMGRNTDLDALQTEE